ncbi:UNKNOWN [Stylonychia lemnae]|uniref:Uncharacterized protein n=1 Tax=Stylonychia lemnae TaxID=5949 RepID=A0A078B4U4_STYLE|nr:UNKNOWN [Stylonychia lemnae]|eukprot:CDW88247.1 UNKNOWN [Stylonychia lemnae]
MFEPAALVNLKDNKDGVEMMLQNKFLAKKQQAHKDIIDNQRRLSIVNKNYETQSSSFLANNASIMTTDYNRMNQTLDESIFNYGLSVSDYESIPREDSQMMVTLVRQNQQEDNIKNIPRSIYVSSKNIEERNLSHLRTKLRKNKFVHHEFNSFLQSKQGKKYYKGVHLPNQQSPSKIVSYQQQEAYGMNENHLQKMQEEQLERESDVDVLDVIVPHHLKYQQFNIFAAKKFSRNKSVNSDNNKASISQNNMMNSTQSKSSPEAHSLSPTKNKQVVLKSIKKIFNQFRDQFNLNEGVDEGKKFDLEQNKRLMKIADEEFKKFMPHWISGSFQHFVLVPKKKVDKNKSRSQSVLSQIPQTERLVNITVTQEQNNQLLQKSEAILQKYQANAVSQLNSTTLLKPQINILNPQINGSSMLEQINEYEDKYQSNTQRPNTKHHTKSHLMRPATNMIRNQSQMRSRGGSVRDNNITAESDKMMKYSNNNESEDEKQKINNQLNDTQFSGSFGKQITMNIKHMNWKQKLQYRKKKRQLQNKGNISSNGASSHGPLTKEEIQKAIQDQNQRIADKLKMEEEKFKMNRIDFVSINKTKVKEQSEMINQQNNSQRNEPEHEANQTQSHSISIFEPLQTKMSESIFNQRKQTIQVTPIRANHSKHNCLSKQKPEHHIYSNLEFKSLINKCREIDLPDFPKLSKQYADLDQHIIREEELKSLELIKAIDTCLLAQVEDKNQLLPSLQDAISQNKLQESVTIDTFLDQDMIAKNREETDQRIVLMRNLKVGTQKLWKPDKLRVTKHLKMKFAFLNEQ